jgi:hypothetical protein
MSARTKHVKKVPALSDAVVKAALQARWGTSQFSPAMLKAEREAVEARRQRRRPLKKSRTLIPGEYD